MSAIRGIIVILTIIIIIPACTRVKVVRYEIPQSEDKTITVNAAGMNDEQQEVARNIMANEIIPLIKEGRTEGEIVELLQKRR